MSHFKNFLAESLRAHPLLHSEPLDVMVHIMCGNSNMEWQQGNYVPLYREVRDTTKMDYSDLEIEDAPQDSADPLNDLDNSYWLRTHAETQRRKLVDQHMDIIVNGDPTRTYFREGFHSNRMIRDLVNGKVGDDPAFLCFPDDIQPDWGEAINRFQDWLLQAMNNAHGVGIGGQTDHWPQDAQIMKEKIQLARESLHPLLHEGQSYQDHMEKITQLSNKIIAELLAEEKAEKTQGFSRPRRSGP